MRFQTNRQEGTAQGAFVLDVLEAVRGGFQRFYVEQLNEVAAMHGLPVYKIPDDWGHCKHERTLRDWMRQVAPAVRAMEAMADPERQQKGPALNSSRTPPNARDTGGKWAPLGGGGRRMAETLHRIAAQSVVKRCNAIHGGEQLGTVEEIRPTAPSRQTDVRAAQTIEDSLGPQQMALVPPKPKTRRGGKQ